jgi:histidinol-phosphate aminotransferase
LYGADGKEVLVADPNYYLFNGYVKQLRGKLCQVPVNERWQTDLDAMARRASKRTRFVYVCNPNNPTGTIVDPVRLRQFCEELGRRAVVFVDEAYYELVEDSRRASMIELVRKGANLVVGRTFSKLFGLAGLRVGYGIGNPRIIEEMRRIQVNLAPVNELGLAAARAAYTDAEYIALIRQRNTGVRGRFYNTLEKLGYQFIPDSQTNFVTFRTRGARQQLAVDLLQKYSIGVHAAHFLAQDWVRVSMGTPEEMDRLTAALQKLS